MSEISATWLYKPEDCPPSVEIPSDVSSDEFAEWWSGQCLAAYEHGLKAATAALQIMPAAGPGAYVGGEPGTIAEPRT